MYYGSPDECLEITGKISCVDNEKIHENFQLANKTAYRPP